MAGIIPLIVLVIVFMLVAVRQIGNIKLQIWQIMLFGAATVLLTMQITPLDALMSINLDVMFFLFGMFVVGRALEESGYLSHISFHLFKKAKNMDMLLLMILFCFGLLSAFLMNDTLAIIGTPLVLLLAKKHSIDAKPLLIALAFAVTIGSVMSPIGNPQNLLIAINGNIPNPFIIFLKYLFVPTIINLFIAYYLIKRFYRLPNHKLNHLEEKITDNKLAGLCMWSFAIILALISIKILIVILKINFDFRLLYIALIGMLPIVLFSEKRIEIIKKIDWYTLIFFAAMFILMQSVWQTGIFQEIITRSNMDITSIPSIFAVSIVLSQLISNVPLVALYTPLLLHLGASTKAMVALAAGSTIAGNLLILGAASNVIIIQNAEKQKKTIRFIEFAKIGIPLTIINVAVYWAYFMIVP